MSSLNEEFRLIDMCIGVRYSYVVIEGSRGRSLGLAFTPLEDLWGSHVEIPSTLSIDSVCSLISSVNPLEKVLGIALLNAISQYIMWCRGFLGGIKIVEMNLIDHIAKISEEPVVIVGNMVPIVRKLRELGFRKVHVLERNPCMRCGYSLSDSLAPRVVPNAKTIIVTGASLVNDTIDYILELAHSAENIALVGPTAGIHPESLRGSRVNVVASLRPIEIDKICSVIKLGGGRWDYSKYCRDYIAIID